MTRDKYTSLTKGSELELELCISFNVIFDSDC